MLELNKIYNMDCIDGMKLLDSESIDLVVTSPPYDNLRTYNNSSTWNFDIFKEVANELYRVLKQGGIIIWVVADATIDGSETGTSFKQALYFKEIGFNLHDTMIYQKENYVPLTHNRYEQEFEYMFCFTKGKPKTFNPIKIKCIYGGTQTWGKSSYYKTSNGDLVSESRMIINEYKIKGNIFSYQTGSKTETGKYTHPAMFPLKLAKDQINSWSNKGDTVLDPFMGSGTTALACIDLYRNYIGFEIDKSYYNECIERIETETAQQRIEL